MAIMRQKKKNIILAAVAGLCIGIIPAGIGAAVIALKYVSVSKEYDAFKKDYKECTAYVLKEEKERGDVVCQRDLKEITFYSKEDISHVEESSLVGKVLRQEGKSGIIITESMVYEDTGIEDDLRMYMFNYIIIPEEVENGTMFDIRIWFPNGEDYIVARAKTIESRTDEGVFINATEKELLMISSACVDTNIYEGAKIYASMYVTDYQNLSVVNYPVNMYVTRLADWNPNLVKEVGEEMDIEKRRVLEANLYEFMGTSIGNTYYEN